MKTLLIPALIVASAANAFALSVFTNKADYLAAIAGYTQLTEDFNSYTQDVSFNQVAVDVGDFTIEQIGNGSFRNTIDVSPFEFDDIDGTPMISGFVDSGVSIKITYESPIIAWGADIGSITAAGLNFNFLQESVSAAGVSGVQFLGFIADSSFTMLTLSAPGNEGFELDNFVAAGAEIPEPMTMGLLATGLGAASFLRKKRA